MGDIVRFHAVATWVDADGYEHATRPTVEASHSAAMDAANRLWGKAGAEGGRNIEATVYQVKYDEAKDRNDRPTVRETRRQFVGRYDHARTWVRASDIPDASPVVMQTWLNVMRASNTSSPAIPPDDVKRAGPQAISDWYRARMDRSEAEAVARHNAVMKELRGEL